MENPSEELFKNVILTLSKYNGADSLMDNFPKYLNPKVRKSFITYMESYNIFGQNMLEIKDMNYYMN